MVLSKIILFISSWLVLNGSFNTSNDPGSCLLYKKGKFVQHAKSQVEDLIVPYDIFIERNDTIETIQITVIPNDTSFYRIKWLSDCTYEREFIRTTSGLLDSVRFNMGERYIKQILTIQPAGKYYLERQGTQTDTVWVKELHITLSEED